MTTNGVYLTDVRKSFGPIEIIKGVEAFPLDRSQDLLDYLLSDIGELQKHLHRFAPEWNTIAKVRVESALNPDSD